MTPKQTYTNIQGPKYSPEMIQIQKMVMKMSPKDLENLEDEDFEDIQDDDADIIDNDDADIINYNTDDSSQADDAIQDDNIGLEESDDQSEKPTLDLSAYYTISIIKTDQNNYRCVFDPTYLRVKKFKNKDIKHTVEKIIFFLTSLVDWLNKNQQKFLAKPTPANFLAGCENNLTQSGLIKQVYRDVDGVDQLSKPDFSLLKDKIWLIWDDKNMPLEAIFSNEFI